VPSRFERSEILLVPSDRFSSRSLTGDGWHADLEDTNAHMRLRFDQDEHREVIADLLLKAVVVGFEQTDGYWRLSNSVRYWYADEMIRSQEGIEMVPRVSFATQPLGDGGVGVGFDFGHLFRTELTVADFFSSEIGPAERGALRRRFDELRLRGSGGKGTLLYYTGNKILTTCYFHEHQEGLTCDSTRGFQIGSEHYDSVYEYYRRCHPGLEVKPGDSVVYVSFENFERPKPVAAKLLRLRVALEKQHLPKGLRKVSMPPCDRRSGSTEAWTKVGEAAISRSGCQPVAGLSRPSQSEQEQLPCPELLFGNGRTVLPPERVGLAEYQRYFRQRAEKLKNGGLYRYEDSVPRVLWLVTPTARGNWSDGLQQAFVTDFCNCLTDISGKTFSTRVVRVDACEQIPERLRNETPSTTVIVFDDSQVDGSSYYLLSHALGDWRLKRLTRWCLEKAWGARQQGRSRHDRQKAERDWQDVIFHSVLDTLDQMDAVLWRLQSWPYDACLTIDVSERRRHFAIAVVICRAEDMRPSFWRFSRSWPKPDPDRESINPIFLEDKIAEVIQEFRGSTFVPLNSLLVLRDGHECGKEPGAINRGVDRWKTSGELSQNAVIDVVDFHKSTIKDLRMWEFSSGNTGNVLEGRAIYLDSERTELAKKAKGVLESFLQRLDHVTSQARTDVVKGVDPRFKELADAYALAQQDSANFNSTLMKAGTDATIRLLWAEEPRAKRELLDCLDDLQRVIQRHQQTDVSAIFEDF